jgi:hypothetical protein
MPRPDFSSIIEDLDHGQVNINASAQLAELVQAVHETGDSGKLVLTLNVSQEGTMCVIKPQVKTSVPRPNAAPSMFFYGKDPGEITREDPRQLALRSIYPSKDAPVDLRNVTPIKEAPIGDARRSAVIDDEEKEE